MNNQSFINTLLNFFLKLLVFFNINHRLLPVDAKISNRSHIIRMLIGLTDSRSTIKGNLGIFAIRNRNAKLLILFIF